MIELDIKLIYEFNELFGEKNDNYYPPFYSISPPKQLKPANKYITPILHSCIQH